MRTSFRDAAGHHLHSSPPRSSQRGAALYRSVTFLTLFSMLFGGLLLLAPTGASAQSTATTTDYLNMRSGPGTGYDIITTMPSGASVSVTGASEAGFYPVTYNGLSGYAAGEWLSIGGSAAPSAPVTNDGATGTAYVHSGALNLRSGPGLGYSIITVMPDSASVQLTGEQGNGFYGVVYRGMSGYASADWLTVGSAPAPTPSNPGSGSTPVGDSVVGSATVTAYALNVRSGPSTGYSIVSTVVSGQSIEIMGDAQSGFYPMRANGVTGWVSGDYISMGGAAPAPAPDPAPSVPSTPPGGSGSVPVGDSAVNTAVVTAGVLNMRSGPSTSYSVVTGMAYGAQVDVMGDPQGGFYPISYYGTKGWASGDYLTIGAAAPAPSNPDSGNDDIISIIYAAADAYGQPRADMLRVARCESVLDPGAVNPYSGASGLFQFMPGTWLTTPFANEDIFDPVSNANAAAWMWSVGRRNEWTCQ